MGPGRQLMRKGTSSDIQITPHVYVDAVRKLMDGIGLDPCSCDDQNRQVQAEHYYDALMDGLQWQWTAASVFLRPRKHIGKWVAKLVEHYEAGDVAQAVLLVPPHVGRGWWKPLWDYPICFTDHRIKFLDGDLKPIPKPQFSNAFVYFPLRGQGFASFSKFDRVFSPFGEIRQL